MFRVFWLAIKDMFDELFMLIGVNFVWLLINLPLFAIAFVLLTGLANGGLVAAGVVLLVSVLVFGPSTAGLFSVAERVTDGRSTGIGLFFSSFRQYARWSWKVYGIWMAVFALLLVNLNFYTTLTSTLGAFLVVLFLYLIAIWFAALIYTGPLVVLQSEQNLRTLGRNVMLMVFGRPIFTFVTLFLMAVIAVLSILIPLLAALLTFSLFALWGMRATKKLIKDNEDRRAALAEKAAQADNPNQANKDKGRGGQIRPRQ